MKNLILIAPPAAGKGTLSESLVKDFNYTHISTGDLLREKQNDGTELGNEIKELMQSGSLVGDDIVTALLKEKLETIEGSFILDGYPRNLKQADILNNLLNELNLNIGKVIYINVSKEVAMERALGRISCSKCGKIYNKYNPEMTPSVEGICDLCGGEIVGRSDDNEESFKVRFDTYVNNTKPLMDYYEEKGLLYITNSSTSKEVFEETKKVI